MPFSLFDATCCNTKADPSAKTVGKNSSVDEVDVYGARARREDVDDPASTPRGGRAITLLRSLESKVSWLDERIGKQDKDVADILVAMRSNLKQLAPLLPKEEMHDDIGKVFKPSVSDSAFPMMVMKMRDFLDLNMMEPHPHLLKSGRLEEAPEDCIVHFISHQWLGNHNPDPQAVQLKQLQRFFRTLMLPNGFHDIFTPADWASFSGGSANKTHAAARSATAAVHRAASVKDGEPVDFKVIFADDIANGYVWLDFASIPQITDEMQEEERKQTQVNQGRAIESIPNYIKAATYFYVCAPAALHENHNLCDFASWRNRGWCRLEEWANFLSPTKTMMPVVITDQPKVSFLEFFDFFLFRAARRECSVFHGQFKCCQCGHLLSLPGGRAIQIPCDKDLLQTVVLRMYDEKLRALLAAGNDFLYRIYKVMEPAVLAGSKEDRFANVCSPDESIASFIQRMRLPADPTEGDGSGAPAVEWAAFMGHVSMVDKLMAEGCPIEIADKGGLTPLLGAALCSESERTVKLLVEQGNLGPDAINAATKGMGITALDRAAKGGKVDVCQYLIEQQATVDIRRSDGATPLMSASDAGHRAVIELLLECEADIEAVDESGQGCLHRAANKFSPHCVERLEREEATVVLLQAGGDPMLKDKQGRTPIQIATEQSNTEFVHAMFSFDQLIMGKEQTMKSGPKTSVAMRVESAMSASKSKSRSKKASSASGVTSEESLELGSPRGGGKKSCSCVLQ